MYYRLIILITVFISVTAGVFSAENTSSIYAPFVSHIKAEEKNGKIILTWKDSETDSISIYKIFRSDFPPENSKIDNLEHIADIAPGIQKFIDQPEPGKNYWYSIFSGSENKSYKIIIPWRNSLGKPVAINPETVSVNPEKEKKEEAVYPVIPDIENTGKGIPLPAICCTENARLSDLPLQIELSEKTSELLSEVILFNKNIPVPEEPEPEILTDDFAGFSSPEEKKLHNVLSGSFKKREWEKANDELFRILAEYSISKPLKDRILFYRGECFYFSGNYNSAFLSFLISSDNYYVESSKWMKQIYNKVSSFYSGRF